MIVNEREKKTRKLSCGLAWPFRAVVGVACSVAAVAVNIVGRYELQRTVYTPCTFIYNANHNSQPIRA